MNNYKKLGKYIQVVNKRNTDLKVEKLLGVSVNKVFINSIANTVGTDFKKYKIVKKHQFTYIPDTSRRGEKIGIALLEDYEKALVSQAYTVFEITDHKELMPEYLMMWFRRPEFDRYARYKSHGSVREIMDWNEMRDIELPIPTLQKQQEIVNEYNTIVNRIKLNEQLNQKLEETAQAIYKHWFVDFEFPYDFAQGKPNEDGKPYKSNGGKMVFNEELEKDIPVGWDVGNIGDLFTFQRGHDLPSKNRINGEYPIFASTGISEFHKDFKINKPTLITGRSGSLGKLFYYDKACWPLNTTLYIKNFKKATPFYSLYFLQTVGLKEMGTGSAVPTLNRNDLHSVPKEIPDVKILELFDSKISIIHASKESYSMQNQKLEELNSLLLSKMSKTEIMVNDKYHNG